MYESTGIHPRSAKAKSMRTKRPSKRRTSRISKSEGSSIMGEKEETRFCLPFKKRRMENLDGWEGDGLPCLYDTCYDEQPEKLLKRL
ncbi:hypothetical protein L6164_023697 [Bauhinia variegata]|uniref:Uncharacterized protein n=1 Tax=Bauhinia variegata TaxID=167791 RepID=A0ACB9MJV3_BAUVA|nr:hypothetical protein L6164_023697 [Bauhinia variegata]